MSWILRWAGRFVLVAFPMGLGVLALVTAGEFRTLPDSDEKGMRPTPVRVITLAPMSVTPWVVGYGTVKPAREWRAVARIDGEVVWTAERLAPGETVPGGTELLRLDETDLRLSLTQVDAQFDALTVKEETLSASLRISRADLDLTRTDMERQQTLADQGVAPRSVLDQARRQELSARAKVTDLENQLALNRAERAVLETQRALTARSLAFTKVRAPYDIRLTEVSAEIGQVVSRGQVMIMAEGTEAVDIDARFAIGKIGPLIRLLPDGGKVTDLTAVVRLPVEGHSVTWAADRVRPGDAIDPTTQSTSLVVRVRNPLDQARAGARPPLRRNTFVEVMLSAPARQALVVPLSAVRGGQALVIADDTTLERRAVDLGHVMKGVAIVAGGLAAGDRLVVTDPAVAVPGMAVKPIEDKDALARIVGIVAGQGHGS